MANEDAKVGTSEKAVSLGCGKPQERDADVIKRLQAENEALKLGAHAMIERFQTAQEELLAARNYANDIVDSVRESLLVLDSELKVVSANRAFYQLFGVSPEETEKRSIYHLVNRQWDIPKLRELLPQVQRRGLEVQNLEVEHNFPAIGRKIVSINARKISGQEINDSPLILLGIQDVTGQRLEAEERALLEEEVRQAQKMGSIGTLTAGIAHEFNNILNIIQNYTFVLSEEAGSNKEMTEILDTMTQNIRRGTALIQELLNLAGREGSRQAIDINALIRELSNLITQTFSKDIGLTLNLAPEIPPLMGDPNQLKQALLNICINARDAMPGGGSLTIKTESAEKQRWAGLGQVKAEKYLCIEIADTGSGIEESIRSRIFDPFFTTKQTGRASGLGLPAVYRIITGHDGMIHMKSGADQGTTFWIFLPILEDRAAALGHRRGPQREKVKQREKKGEASHKTILFVEDEMRQLDLMQKVLEGEGYTVLAANDGKEAVETYLQRREEIALVILDLELPVLDGWEALQKMREVNPNLKAIIATGYVSPQIESSIRKGDLSQVILKPYRLDEVLEKISELVQ